MSQENAAYYVLGIVCGAGVCAMMVFITWAWRVSRPKATTTETDSDAGPKAKILGAALTVGIELSHDGKWFILIGDHFGAAWSLGSTIGKFFSRQLMTAALQVESLNGTVSKTAKTDPDFSVNEEEVQKIYDDIERGGAVSLAPLITDLGPYMSGGPYADVKAGETVYAKGPLVGPERGRDHNDTNELQSPKGRP